MKISKLFHWLYAILMFLPILVFIPNAFYYGFNEQAVAQEKTEQVPVYYDSNEIDTIDDFLVGNVYTWKDNIDPTLTNQGTYFNIKILNGNYINSVGLFYVRSSGNAYLQTLDNNYIALNDYSFDFYLESFGSNYTIMNEYLISKFSICNTKYVKEYRDITTKMSITDSMSYAWKSTWQNELFSWSYDSFLTQPFLYITNLFNVPATNTLLYCLSYWLNISIIWLCFDVVMYVPLLVHRWLDKGIVE